jgi:hypothetical protein
MTEPAQPHPDHVEGDGPEGFDHEVDLRVVVWIGVILAGATVVVALLMWWLVVGFERFDAAREPAAPPLAEARRPVLPPGPRLQTTPERDLRAMRADEDHRLREAAWVDRARGTVRIPIELAMDAVVAGVKPAPGSATAPAGTAPLPGTGGIGAPVSPQPLADAESRQPPPQTTEEAPPP